MWATKLQISGKAGQNRGVPDAYELFIYLIPFYIR